MKDTRDSIRIRFDVKAKGFFKVLPKIVFWTVLTILLVRLSLTLDPAALAALILALLKLIQP